MSTVIKVKRSETASSVPTTSDLAVGEIAVNTADKKVYVRASGGVVEVANVVAGGASGDITEVLTATGSGSAAFVLTRTPDADAASELVAGAFAFVEEGTANADNGYVLSTDGAVTLGTTAINFEQFSGAGQISAGDGLSKTGNALSLNVDNSSIEINADTARVKALGVTNAMLAGSIANAKLSNSSVTINSNSLALGASLTLDTDDIGEGSTNQYYTNARSRAALSVTGSTGLTYNDSTGVLAGLDATASVKGVASFASANFTVTSGAVAITGVDGGTY